MLNSPFTIDEATYSSVSELCENLVRQSRAACALLVGQDGMLLHACGSVEDLDVDSLAALAAGVFASSREIARMIGEPTFDVATQQGRRNHLQLIRVADCAILVAVFDDRTTAGMVRLYGLRVARRLARLLAEGDAAGSEESAGRRWTDAWEDEVDAATTLEGDDREPIEFASRTQTRAEQLRAALHMRTASLVLALLAAGVAVVGALLRH
jgi:predicted regulator of Ras-like GTPase activity (Roadblock/LC7/MglB family)